MDTLTHLNVPYRLVITGPDIKDLGRPFVALSDVDEDLIALRNITVCCHLSPLIDKALLSIKSSYR
jgi:hypothetical protein